MPPGHKAAARRDKVLPRVQRLATGISVEEKLAKATDALHGKVIPGIYDDSDPAHGEVVPGQMCDRVHPQRAETHDEFVGEDAAAQNQTAIARLISVVVQDRWLKDGGEIDPALYREIA